MRQWWKESGAPTRLEGSRSHHDNAWSAALDYLLRGKEPLYSLEEAVADIVVLDAVGRSAASGCPEEVW